MTSQSCIWEPEDFQSRSSSDPRSSVGWRSLHVNLGPLLVKCKGTVPGLREYKDPTDELHEYIARGADIAGRQKLRGAT